MNKECFILIVKYCYNQVDYFKFKEIMNEIGFDNETYIMEKWRLFSDDMNRFLVTNELFLDKLIEKIKKEKYNG
jgi:hypothetical protein